MPNLWSLKNKEQVEKILRDIIEDPNPKNVTYGVMYLYLAYKRAKNPGSNIYFISYFELEGIFSLLKEYYDAGGDKKFIFIVSGQAIDKIQALDGGDPFHTDIIFIEKYNDKACIFSLLINAPDSSWYDEVTKWFKEAFGETAQSFFPVERIGTSPVS